MAARGLAVRVEMLEKQHDDLQKAIARVELEQGRVQQVIDSRFRALDKGQEILSVKFDSLAKDIATMAGDPDQSPAGRLINERIAVAKGEVKSRVDDIEKRVNEAQDAIDSMKTLADNVRGGLILWKASGVAGLLLAIAALVLSYLYPIHYQVLR